MIRHLLTLAAGVWLGAIRRKDLYVMLILLGGLFLAIASGNLFGLGGMAVYIQDVGLLLAWLFGWILAVLASSRELPQEEMRGTMLSLVSKPVSRLEIIVGKWLGTWTLTTAATALFYLLVLGASLRVGGKPDGTLWGQAFVLHAACLAVINAMGILFSTRIHGDSAATLTGILSAAAFLIVPRIPEMQARAEPIQAGVLEALYHLLPHFDVFDARARIVHDFGPLDPLTHLEILGYGAAVTAFFLACAWAAFRTKKFTRRGNTL